MSFFFIVRKGNEAGWLFFRNTIIKILLHFLLQIINCNACNQINGLPPTRFVLEILITSEQSHNFPDGFNGINKARMYPYIIYVTIFQIMSRYHILCLIALHILLLGYEYFYSPKLTFSIRL